ncbi:MAG: DUF4091 domain-containing protein [Armatimonadetes bacterium]|nr:DUF4091 domain-containing protein [Armatimonadota bacterium]
MIPLLCLLLVLLATVTVLAEGPAPPTPRVAGTYSSWLEGAYAYRESLDALYQELGWPYVRVENTQVSELIADLDRFDVFCPPALYNYSNAQPFEAHLEAWKRFLERGGILFAVDANYGQQLSWVSALGPGLELACRQCPEGMSDPKSKHPVPVVADDPFTPPGSATLPWAHFESCGAGWQVLATCPEGKPLLLKARIGKGVLIATNLYSDAGFPTPEYLKRVWEAHWPTIMEAGAVSDCDSGRRGIGRNRLTASLPAEASVAVEIQAEGGPWEAAPATVPYVVGPGRTDVRLVIRRGELPIWWTGFTVQQPDVPGLCDALEAKLAPHTALVEGLGDHPLRDWHDTLTAKTRETGERVPALLDREAGEETQRDWDAAAELMGALNVEAAALNGRLSALAAHPEARGKRFLVVPARPLDKLLRDEPPPSGTSGSPVRIEAARGEGESVQVAVVPLDRAATGVRVSMEPLRSATGAEIGGDALELYRVGSVHVPGPSPGTPAGQSWWPDPLLPIAGPFDVGHTTQPVWLDLFVPRDATPGEYTGALRVEAEGQVERVPIALRVREFALPVEHALRQLFVLRAYVAAQKYLGGDGDDYAQKVPLETMLAMADVCLKRRLGTHVWGNEAAQHLTTVAPYLRETKTDAGWEFDFTETDRIWQHLYDSGCRTICVGFTPGCGSTSGATNLPDYWEFLEAYLRVLQPHLEEKGWLDEAVWYMVDESWQESAITANMRLAELMDRVAPKIKRLATAPRDPRLVGLADIWVPGGLPEAHPNDPASQDLLKAWAPHDPERWWYICCGPVHPYPNFFVDYPTIDPRMVFWLTWKYEKTGFLYWGVEYHGDPKQMTPDGPTEQYPIGPPHMGNGDGTLCYWGPEMTLYPSIRLNVIRDGLEDYEYLALLKRLADDAEQAGRALEAVARARELLGIDERVLKRTDGSPNFTYTTDPEALLAARRTIAEAIEAFGAETGGR